MRWANTGGAVWASFFLVLDVPVMLSASGSLGKNLTPAYRMDDDGVLNVIFSLRRCLEVLCIQTYCLSEVYLYGFYMEGFHQQPKIRTSSFQVDESCVRLVLRKAIARLKRERKKKIKAQSSTFHSLFQSFLSYTFNPSF